jgi:flagellar biosynthesis anti-sigma factor FlgM
MRTIKLNGANPPDATRAAQRGDTGRLPAVNQASLLASAGPAVAMDAVAVSMCAAAVSNLVARAVALPAIRHERVDSLRPLVHSGSYRPEAQAIADAIIEEEAIGHQAKTFADICAPKAES